MKVVVFVVLSSICFFAFAFGTSLGHKQQREWDAFHKECAERDGVLYCVRSGDLTITKIPAMTIYVDPKKLVVPGNSPAGEK